MSLKTVIFFVLLSTLLAPNTLTALSPGFSLSKMEDRKLEKSHCHATRLKVTLVNDCFFFICWTFVQLKERYQGLRIMKSLVCLLYSVLILTILVPIFVGNRENASVIKD